MFSRPVSAEVATQLIRHPELLSTTIWDEQSLYKSAQKSYNQFNPRVPQMTKKILRRNNIKLFDKAPRL